VKLNAPNWPAQCSAGRVSAPPNRAGAGAVPQLAALRWAEGAAPQGTSFPPPSLACRAVLAASPARPQTSGFLMRQCRVCKVLYEGYHGCLQTQTQTSLTLAVAVAVSTASGQCGDRPAPPYESPGRAAPLGGEHRPSVEYPVSRSPGVRASPGVGPPAESTPGGGGGSPSCRVASAGPLRAQGQGQGKDAPLAERERAPERAPVAAVTVAVTAAVAVAAQRAQRLERMARAAAAAAVQSPVRKKPRVTRDLKRV
jgi:hypothetical protein